MANTYTSLGSLFTAIANAIRAKKGTTDTIVADNFPSEIESIASQPSLQSKTVSPSTAAQTITPDSGYDGLSQVVVNAISPTKGAQTYTPTTTDQTISSGRWLTGAQTIKGDANLVASNIKSGVSIFGVSGSITPIRYVELSSSDFSVYNGVVKINIPNYETGEYIAALSGVYKVTGTDEKKYTFIFYKERSNPLSAYINFTCFDDSTSKYRGESAVAVNNETSIILQPSGIGGVTVSSLEVSYSYGYLCMAK